jgi:putative ABC transport system permease protein
MVVSKEEVKYSLKKLIQRPGRSFLTIFSMLIGITAIFIFISFGLGLYNYVNQFATGSSADKITITSKGSAAPGLSEDFALTDTDLRAIDNSAGVYEVSPLYAKAAEINQDKARKFVFLLGYDPEKPIIFEMGNIELYKGRWLKKGESGKVLLGYNYLIKDKIFPKIYDINDKILIQGKEFRIIGFLDAVGNPQDDSQIYMTSDAMNELYGSNLKGYNYVIAKVDISNIDTVIEKVKDNLRRSRNLEKGKEDFFVQSWEQLIATYSNVLNGIIGFIILIALISVIVSAINTANTMITSVLERRKEIGIMKAVGAQNSEIFNVFLFESAFLGFVAGLFGVLFGYIFTSIATRLLVSLGWGFIQPAYSLVLFISLISFATITGAVSGAVPAYRASRISPVQALRYE